MDKIAGILAELAAHPDFTHGVRQRGSTYAQAGRVLKIERDGADDWLMISGLVLGASRYRSYVAAARAPDGDLEVTTSCSCPTRRACEHAYALVVELRERLPRRPDWRSVLDEVLDEAAASTQVATPTSPVALEVVLPTAASVARHGETGGVPRIGLRVLRRGSGRRWVRRGVEWSRIGGEPYAATYGRPWAKAQPAIVLGAGDVEALSELKTAVLGRRGYLGSSSDALSLQDAGPSLWSALDRVLGRGIPLLCSDPTVAVRVSPTPAAVQLDIGARGKDVAVRAGIALGSSWIAAATMRLVGQPAHGVVISHPTDQAGTPGGTLVLAPLERPVSAALRTWIDDGAELLVERSALPELMADYLPAIAKAVPLTSEDGSVALPGRAKVTLGAEVTWDDEGGLELDLRWLYRRGDERQQFPLERHPEARGWRDPEAEVAVVERLAENDELEVLLGLGLSGAGSITPRVRLRDVDAMHFAAVQLGLLQAHPDVEVVTNGAPPDFREVSGVPEIHFSARGEAERKGRTDWLDLEVIVTVTDAEHGQLSIGLPQVLAALASGQPLVMVRRGVWVNLDRPELDRLARLVQDARSLADQPAGGLRVSREAHGVLADVHELGATEGQLAHWAAASASLRDLAEHDTPLPDEPLPRALQATLRPYQLQGYGWLSFLRRHRLGGVLADDMGLGKTLQTLAMIDRAREEDAGSGGRTPFLVVAPSSVVGTWCSEVARFAPDLRVVTVSESTSRRGWPVRQVLDPALPADIVVTTYTLLRLEAEQYAEINWSGLVLDEAQTVKNHRSKTWAAVRDVPAECRFAITGTPLENNLMELWSILALTAPGLFPQAEAFRNFVAKPIEQDHDVEVRHELLRRVRPVLLRRTKELVAAELPPKQEQVVEIELSPRHRRLYDTHLQRERQRILQLLDEDPEGHRITILASLTRLRQLSLDPALVDSAHDGVGSAKIDQLVDQLTEVTGEGHRALVFSQFTGFLARVRARLDAEGIGYAYLDGSTRHRQQVVDGFRSGSEPVFLVSLKAGGVGLNLTEADYCFVLDPWWNPAVEAQAVDRTHRIGQTRPVMVYRYVAVDTIEQKVVALAARKAELFRSILDGDGAFGSAITTADLASLVR